MAEAEEFRLEADRLQQVVNGLNDVKSQIQAIVATAQGQQAANGTPWQFAGAPAGVGGRLDDVHKSGQNIGDGVGGLAGYLDSAVKIFGESDTV